MSISPVGNSDAYARYRQQALDLLASPSQVGTQSAPTTSPSYVTPPDATDQSASNPFTAKFKADLTALNSSQNGNSHAHAHHHHTGGANKASDATTASTDSTTATDPIDQSLDEFANLLKTATTIA